MVDHFNDASRNIMMLVAFQNTIERLSFNIPTIAIACIFILLWIFSDKIKSFSFYYERSVYKHSQISKWIDAYANSITVLPNSVDRPVCFKKNLYTFAKYYNFTVMFSENVWYEIDGIHICSLSEKKKSNNNNNNNDNNRRNNDDLLVLKSTNKYEIEKFIIKCQKHYSEKNKGPVYYYIPTVQHEITETGKLETRCVWTNYEMIITKTFDNLFLEEKQKIIDIIDNFQNKADIYNFTQHKLGLLLKGPAGSGKSSFIKTIAKKLERHIVNIPIENIKSNEDFFNILFSTEFIMKTDNGHSINLEKDEVIYVIEDIDRIDCALKLEYQRKQLFENTDTNSETDDFIETDVSRRKNRLQSKLLTTANKSDNTLNLAGLLNVIDGVVETPGRIIIFTANHPERLDPALMRPGRIDYVLTFDYIKKEQFIEMITYFKIHVSEELIDELFSYKPEFTCAYVENEVKNHYVNKTDFIKNLIDAAKENNN